MYTRNVYLSSYYLETGPVRLKKMKYCDDTDANHCTTIPLKREHRTPLPLMSLGKPWSCKCYIYHAGIFASPSMVGGKWVAFNSFPS